MGHKFQNFSGTVLPGLVSFGFTVRDRCLKHVDVLLGGDCDLWLEVLELYRRDENTSLLAVTAIVLVAQVVNCCVHYTVYGDQGELVET